LASLQGAHFRQKRSALPEGDAVRNGIGRQVIGIT
jgi:hypothetical protein